MSQSRQLAAIMFTDIVGYTALMGEDEQQAFELLKKNRQVQRPVIEKYHGKWLKEIGDGVLASFSTVSDAVYCAKEIQKICQSEPDLDLRIGIHLGEVVFEGDDVFGDGVNIASRLEPLAPVGGVLVSESVNRNLSNKRGIETRFVREVHLKNVKEPVRIYSVQIDGVQPLNPEELSATKAVISKKSVFAVLGFSIFLLLSFLLYSNLKQDTPQNGFKVTSSEKSIVVLPFMDMSVDKNQEYFSDGIMEEILNHLVKIEDLKVISRTTAMQYKGSPKTIREITKELKVVTALEGSVRKDGDQVRITVQLIDGDSDTHLWSESYDRQLTNIFEIQSEVARHIAQVLQADLSLETKRRIQSQLTSDPEAYSLYLMAARLQDTEVSRAIDLYEQAILRDPEFASAYANLGKVKRDIDPNTSPQTRVTIARPYLEKALELDPENYQAHLIKGQSHLWYEWDFIAAYKEYQFLKDHYPNSFNLPALLLSTGRFKEALENSRRNLETDPLDPFAHSYYIWSLYFSGKLDEISMAISNSMNLCKANEGHGCLFLFLRIAEVYQFLGQYLQSQEIVETFLGSSDIHKKLSLQAINYFHLGQLDQASSLLQSAEARSEESEFNSPSFHIAMIYAQMGDSEGAFKWLEKSYQNREQELYWLKVYPSFEPLHDHPRWSEMLKKVGFPEFI